MRKALWWLSLIGLLLLGLSALAPAAGFSLTEAILQGRSWTFTPLQTFSGGIQTNLPIKNDYSMSAPLLAPSVAEGPSGGSCVNGDKASIVWINPSGSTTKGPLSAAATISGSKKMTVTLTETPPAKATAWAPVWTRSSTTKFCAGSSFNSTNSVAVGTTTFDCTCSPIAASWTDTNTTAVKQIALVDTTGVMQWSAFSTSFPFFISELTRRLDFGSALLPFFSLDSGTTKLPFMLAPGLVKRVCKSGCEFSTVSTALTAITDATSTKRYTVLVEPGDYDESIVPKAWVSLVGTDRSAVRLRGASAATPTILIPQDVTPTFYYNLTIGGETAIKSNVGNTAYGEIYVADCIMGITDGTEFATPGKTNIGLSLEKKISAYVRDTTWNVRQFVAFARFDTAYYSVGDRIYGSQIDGTFFAPYNRDEGGVIIDATGFQMYLTTAATTGTLAGYASIIEPVEAGAVASRIRLQGDIVIVSTNSSRTTDIECFRIDKNESSGLGIDVNVGGSTCTVTAAGTSAAIHGIKVISDGTDHNGVAVRWNGGRILRSGGSSGSSDVDQNETTSGFSLALSNLDHAGVYTGSGAVLTGNPTDQHGACVFAAATTCSVTLPFTAAVSTYDVTLGCNANKTFWTSSKTTTGFTINASSSSSDTCSWRLAR